MFNIAGYFEARSVGEATQLLAANPQLKIIAGGTDVLIKMHGGQLEEAELLSIRNIHALERIEKLADGTIVIGPLATFTKLCNDPVIKDKLPALAEAALSMGGPQIRNIATIGGNVCNGATSADSASTLFALNARLKLTGNRGERIVPIEEFYLGPGQVDLRGGEILTDILIASADYQGFAGHYVKFAMRKAMDIATLGVSVACKLTNGKMFEEVRIALGVAAPTPIRCCEAEEYARGKEISAEILTEMGKLAVNSTQARTSWRASKEYREHLVEVLTERALRVAIERAGGVNFA